MKTAFRLARPHQDDPSDHAMSYPRTLAMSARSRWAQRRWIPWLAIITGLACALVAAEGALRVFYVLGRRPELEFTRYSLLFKQPARGLGLPFEHAPNRVARLMGVTIRTNAQGLRGELASIPKPRGTFRVACVGDSLTLGWGVDEADTYCEQLARRLTAHPVRPTQPRAKGINFGVGNYNTVMELAVLRGKVFTFQPDLVVLQYYINDAEPTPVFRHNPLIAHSYLAVFLWARVDLLLRAAGARPDYVQYYRGLYAVGQPGVKAFREAIAAFARECREHKVPLVVLLFPELHRLDAGEPFQDIYAQVQAWWEAEGVPVINLWARFFGQDPRQFWVHPADVHPNARAYTIAAEALERFVRREAEKL